MLINLEVNAYTSRVASAAELRQELVPFASQQFREIWVRVDPEGPSLCALMNTNVGWLMYLRHDEGDTGFSSRNPMFDESDVMLGGLVSVGLVGGEHVPVIAYRLSNGQGDQYPASWALPERDIMYALEYFVEHEGRRPPFVKWHDDGLEDGQKMGAPAAAEDLPDSAQKEQAEFTVVLRAIGEKKIEVIREVRALTRLGLKEAKDLVEGVARHVKERVTRNEAERIKASLEKVGAKVELKRS